MSFEVDGPGPRTVAFLGPVGVEPPLGFIPLALDCWALGGGRPILISSPSCVLVLLNEEVAEAGLGSRLVDVDDVIEDATDPGR